MKYAIYSDVDGTIYSHNQEYHQETKESIKMAQEKGIEFIMCTGNPHFENMQKMSNELGVNYFVGSNGAFIFDVTNQKVVKLTVMKKEDSQMIIDTLVEMEIGGDWWDSENLYANKFIEPEVRKILNNVISGSRGLIETHEAVEGIHKIEGYTPNTPEGIKKIDELEAKLKGHGLQVARMKPFHLEITMPNVSKGHAVKWLSKELGIDLDNVMTIGDSANDHSMFNVTDYAYAMGNADEKTKSIAKLHTSSVDQNGLGEAILDFMFRKRLTDNFKGQK